MFKTTIFSIDYNNETKSNQYLEFYENLFHTKSYDKINYPENYGNV